MSFAVDDFRRNFSGGARPNLFAVFMQAPEIVSGSRDAGQLTWLCQTAQLPGSTLGMIEQPYMGRTYKIPGNRTFEDLTTTVLNDEDFSLRKLLERWDDAMSGRSSNRQVSTGGLLTSGNVDAFFAPKLSAVQYARDGHPIREYEFVGAWPSAIGAIELGWDSNDTIETYDITWTYSWYETKDTIGSIVDNLIDDAGSGILKWAGFNPSPEDFSVGQ